MPEEIERAVLITGSASGIGAAIARRLAGPGQGMLIHARDNGAGCDRVAAEAEAAGASTVIALGDLAEPGVAEALVDQAVDAFGRLDVVIANAGFPVVKTYAEVTDQELARCTEVMMGGFLRLTQKVRPHLERATGAG